MFMILIKFVFKHLKGWHSITDIGNECEIKWIGNLLRNAVNNNVMFEQGAIWRSYFGILPGSAPNIRRI